MRSPGRMLDAISQRPRQVRGRGPPRSARPTAIAIVLLKPLRASNGTEQELKGSIEPRGPELPLWDTTPAGPWKMEAGDAPLASAQKARARGVIAQEPTCRTWPRGEDEGRQDDCGCTDPRSTKPGTAATGVAAVARAVAREETVGFLAPATSISMDLCGYARSDQAPRANPGTANPGTAVEL